MKVALLSIAAALAASCAPAAPDITVTDAWARATAPGQSSAAAYATIVNKGGSDRLVGVEGPTGAAMLHRSEQEGGVARMRMLNGLDIPAGEQVELAPGGTHVMLTGLTAPLVPGTELPLTFRFAEAGTRTLRVAVVAAGAR